MTATPPPIEPSRPRPRPGHGWYIVAAVILVVGIGGGCTAGVLQIRSSGELPPMRDQFDSDEPVTVELSADQEWAVYAEHDNELIAPAVECRADSFDGHIELLEPSRSFKSDDWKMVRRVKVSADGEYTFDCTEGLQTRRLAIDESVDTGELINSPLGIMMAFVLLPATSLLLGLCIIIAARTKRRESHRKRSVGLRADSPHS